MRLSVALRPALTMLLASVALAAGRANAQTPVAPPDLDDGLRTGSAVSAHLDTALLARLSEATRTSAFPKTTSVLIVRGGRLVYEAYFADGQRGLLNDTRSATKTITALAVGAAVADGRIASVGAPVFPFFAAEQPPQHSVLRDAITVEDLLTMSSALDCDDGVSDSPGNEDHMYPQKRWLPWVLGIPIKAGYARDSVGRGPFA